MRTFVKSQTVSLIATIVDFTVTLLLSEIGGLYQINAHAFGLFSGGCTQFTLNRKWAFKKGKRTNKMLLRFICVWLFNFSVNTFLVWFSTTFFEWNFLISKVLVSSIMAVSINFFLQKEYVFK